LKGIEFKSEKKKWITGTKSDFLNEMIKDCIYYGLSDNESLDYVQRRFGESISKSILWARKAKLRSEESGRIWLSWFSREGFVIEQMALIEKCMRILNNSMKMLFVENQKPYVRYKKRMNLQIQSIEDTDEILPSLPHQVKNDFKILRLQKDIRESLVLYRDLMLDTPVIAEVKAAFKRELDLKIKLLNEWGIMVTDEGELIQERGLSRIRQIHNNQDSNKKDPQAVF
jgi:hypothetical protein